LKKEKGKRKKEKGDISVRPKLLGGKKGFNNSPHHSLLSAEEI
jgi:hypothetical protein